MKYQHEPEMTQEEKDAQEWMNAPMGAPLSTTSSEAVCNKCNKPLYFFGRVPEGGFPKGLEPYCTCYEKVDNNKWKYCPHCGRELK